jgi:HaeII restriction endonuclease
MNIEEAKIALDNLIRKSRVHLYKPIQIAETLYRDRVFQDIDLNQLETYRNPSKKWRDIICLQFLGRISTSSSKFQDNLFDENAISPQILSVLGQENKEKKGIVEYYIYKKFSDRFYQLNSGLDYCKSHNIDSFNLQDFLNYFRQESGLKRSIDKVYEIVVYALFSALVEALDITIEISLNPLKTEILQEFEDFAQQIMTLSPKQYSIKVPAKLYRVGVTNAADRGLDLWANFGLAIQVKHLSLDEKLAENIVNAISADRIIIICKQSEKKVILSLLNQIGWRAKIQSIITEADLIQWYEKALKGKFREQLGNKILNLIQDEIYLEFPATDRDEFNKFMEMRGYNKLKSNFWQL